MSQPYRAHPAIGIRPPSWRPDRLLGEERPPFWWMRLSAKEQQERESAFFRQLMGHVGSYPSLEVAAAYPTAEEASAVAQTIGLRQSETAVVGEVSRSGLAVFADEPPQCLQIASRGVPLLEARPGQLGVTLWIESDDARVLESELEATVGATMKTKRAAASTAQGEPQTRTTQAALMIALDYLLLAAIVGLSVLIMTSTDDNVGGVAAFALAVAGLVAYVFPAGALGEAVKRRWYDMTSSRNASLNTIVAPLTILLLGFACIAILPPPGCAYACLAVGLLGTGITLWLRRRQSPAAPARPGALFPQG